MEQINQNILVLDDDANIGKMIKFNLERTGHYNVLTALNSATADQLLQENDIDLLLLDLILDGEDGEIYYKKLVQHFPHLPVIVISASESVQKAIRLLSLGAKEYLVKPFAMDHIVQMVDTYVKTYTNYKNTIQIPGKNELKTQLHILAIGFNTIEKQILLNNADSDFNILFADEETEYQKLHSEINFNVVIVSDDLKQGSIFDIYEHVKTANSNIKFIPGIYSDDSDTLETLFEKGITTYLLKPLDATRLHTILQELKAEIYADVSFHFRDYTEINQIRIAMDRVLKSDDKLKIMIMSPEEGDGKTFTSWQLAKNLAKHSDKKILLVDLNRKNPELNRITNSSRKNGIAEIVIGMHGTEENIQQTNYPNLYFLSAGNPAISIQHYLTSFRLYDIITQLEKNFDILIFDTSPLLLRSKENIDPAWIVSNMNVNIMVVSPRKTRKRILQNAIERITNSGGEVTGYIVNNQYIPNSKSISDWIIRLRDFAARYSLLNALFIRRRSQ